MRELITIGNPWIRYTEHILNPVTIKNTQYDANQAVIDHPEVHPSCIYDSNIHTDTTGFIYCIMSMHHSDKSFIEEIKYLDQIIVQHNSCNISHGTAAIHIYLEKSQHIYAVCHILKNIQRMS